MKHLLIDVTFLINELKRKRPPHGIPRVVLAYLSHYSDNMQLLYRLRGYLFIFSKAISQEITRLLLEWDFKSYKPILRLLIKGVLHSVKMNPDDHYFLIKLDQNGMKYPAYFNAIEKRGIKLIVVIHDLFPIVHPEYSDPNYTLQFEKNIKSSIRFAKGLICVSESTRQLLTTYVQSIHKACPPAIAAPLAAGLSPLLPREKCPINGPYFVMVSTLVARKNHLLLLQIWRRFAQTMKDKTPTLILIGKRSSECSSTLAMLDRCKDLRGKVIEAQVSDQELANYLAHARALLFPTAAEGYGLPLMEALSMKVPVIASDLAIFHEIADDIPDYLDPLDGKGWMELILDYAQEKSPMRDAQLKRLDGFTMPTWDDHFNKVDLFVDKLSIPKILQKAKDQTYTARGHNLKF